MVFNESNQSPNLSVTPKNCQISSPKITSKSVYCKPRLPLGLLYASLTGNPQNHNWIISIFEWTNRTLPRWNWMNVSTRTNTSFVISSHLSCSMGSFANYIIQLKEMICKLLRSLIKDEDWKVLTSGTDEQIKDIIGIKDDCTAMFKSCSLCLMNICSQQTSASLDGWSLTRIVQAQDL